MDPQDRFHLPQDEERLLQYLDGQLPAPEARAAEAHLAVCPECQALRRQWAQLDERLAGTLARPRLPPDFAARLRQQVAGEEKAGAPGVQASQSSGPEALSHLPWFEAGGLWTKGLWLKLLDGLGYATAAAMGGYWLHHLMVAWIPGSAGASAAFMRGPASLFALVAAGAALLLGLNLAAKNRVLRWLGGL